MSPLLFCLCTAPVSAMLRGGGGFRGDFLEEPFTHLSFMDDLKCYEEHKEELTATAGAVQGLSAVIGMSFGVSKCSVSHMRAGKRRHPDRQRDDP